MIAKHTYTKMNQDISRSKFSPEVYYEGRNIRILTNEAFGSVTNAKGNELIATLPTIPSNPTTTKTHLNKLPFPLEKPTLLGHAYINEDLYLLSKYAVENPFAKLFYAQVQSGDSDLPGPYIDSNIRVVIDGDIDNAFFNFDSTNGAVEGPQLPTNTPVSVTAFAFGDQPNQPAPNPTIYLQVYKNDELIFSSSKPVDYNAEAVTDITYNFTTDFNSVYYFFAYTLPEPGPIFNPFENIDIFDYIVEGDIFTIHKLDKDYNVTLKFIDIYNVGDNKIDVWGFYENQLNQKLYWATGTTPLSFINVANPDVLELNKKFLLTVPNSNLVQPQITGFGSGGSHTSGSIQYAYNLYKLNGAQTKVSPLSEIVYLNTGDRGQDVNLRVDKTVNLKIENVDTQYDRIRIYSIKYNSLDSTPTIKIIYENFVSSTIEFTDDNNTNIGNISLPEFLFLGGDSYIPQHIFIKDNRLFLANYKTQQFDIDFDARAYRYDINGNTVIKDSTRADITSTNFTPPSNVPLDFDAINPTNKAVETSINWNKYIWKTAPTIIDPGGSTDVPATFNNLFTLTNNVVTFEEYYWFDDNTSGSPQAHDFVTGFITTISTYNINPNYIATGRTLDGQNVGLAVQNLVGCSGDFQTTYPGDWEWGLEISGNGTILTITTQYTYTDRCAMGSINNYPMPATVTLSNNDNTIDVAFDILVNNQTSQSSTASIINFDNGGAVITVIIPPVIEGGKLGGIGPNVEFEVKYRSISSNNGQATMLSEPSMATTNTPSELTSLKSGEVYRMFLEFQLEDGSFLFPKWIADIKIPEIGSVGSLPPVDDSGVINYCYIETKLLNQPKDSRIIGWRTSIVERTEFDRNVITQGIYNPSIENNFNRTIDTIPSYLQRTMTRDIANNDNITDLRKPKRFNVFNTSDRNLSSNNDTPLDRSFHEITAKEEDYMISRNSGSLYTPETIVEKRLLANAAKIRVTGLIKNTFSTSSREVYDNNGLIVNTLSTLPTQNLTVSNSTHPGALLLMNIIANNEGNRVRLGKFISDNKDSANTQIYSRRKHAFVRYFGGYNYTYIPNQAANYINLTQLNQLPFRYTAPIVNVYNIDKFNAPGFTEAFSPNGQIRVAPTNTTLQSTGTDYFQGSAITFTNLLFQFDILSDIIANDDNNDYGLVMELYRIVDNQYGGDTYAARQLNRTIPYSSITPLNQATQVHIGDTFIQKFNFLKTFKTSVNNSVQISEIVSFPVETSINLDLRWDILKNRPDNFDADEITSYGFNRAYDQNNNTIKGVTKPLNFTELNEFPVNIIPSKLKIAGELIDSFTDFLVNDIETLDGKYGEITGIGEHSDNIFTFQRKAVAYLAINPRVQLQTNDTIPIELGSGGIIERYQYLTTSSGTLNKWSIVKSNNGLMYVDILNKSINFIGADNNKMSTVNGLYNKLFSYIDTHYSDLIINNPVVGKGIIAYYDNLKEETYFTFLSNDSFTVSYNGLAQGFVSFYDYFPRHYLTVDSKMITTKDNKTLWEHNTPSSLYNTFYGSYFPSYITLISNDNPDINKIFDNIHYNSEFYNNNVDLPSITFNKLRVTNEYQDTGLVTINPLDYRGQSKRRFRKWNFIIPRQSSSRNRINNPWVFITLEFDRRSFQAPYNTMNIRFVLHDMLVSYTPKP